MGLLEVQGSIDLSQFWQEGQSDADTVKVTLDKNAFSFQSSPNSGSKITHVFDDAQVAGKVRKSPIDKKGRLTIRLQGIDAPELHYRPSPLSTKEKSKYTTNQLTAFKDSDKDYRQHFGETATVQLHELLKKSGSDTIECKVKTSVKEPNEVFDTYGRFIGDIIVEQNSKELNINHWLVENGWAFPTFYVSMSTEEITSLTEAAKKGHKNKNGIWKYYTGVVGTFDYNLTFRSHGMPDAKSDAGSLVMPKIFRRQCTYSAYKKAKIISGSYVDYLKNHPDACFLTKDILEQGISASKPYFLHMFFKGSTLTEEPQDLAFSEEPSTLVDNSGKKILTW